MGRGCGGGEECLRVDDNLSDEFKQTINWRLNMNEI